MQYTDSTLYKAIEIVIKHLPPLSCGWFVVNKIMFLGMLEVAYKTDTWICKKVLQYRRLLTESLQRGQEYPVAFRYDDVVYALIPYDKLTAYAESGKTSYMLYRSYDLLTIIFLEHKKGG